MGVGWDLVVWRFLGILGWGFWGIFGFSELIYSKIGKV